MNERTIQRALISKAGSGSILMPNYTPAGWWECDLLEITEAGYFREYEIKVSVSDFKADRKKSTETTSYKKFYESEEYKAWEALPNSPEKYDKRPEIPRTFKTKHSLIEECSVKAPSQFWYVTPPALLNVADIPSWAGLIEVQKTFLDGDHMTCKEVKAAPRLHRNKVDEKFVRAIYKTGYNRYRFNVWPNDLVK